ncbi:RagB/SusD family nutrient uptake outer membrane protein [Hymenobacter sp. BT491]|uniref:RagB/SusD family nutrient uptake outer membrane protein n=1 Tax=Hymenobacter sp. BT491 TaxID=2766779 RepID=UPI0016539560|nr:RagB/SusD family nutrient uptake outer membrane protein [Hymenobacter sp. BT491]MBC6988788.1 RagB/SusD family nutrient uptake outer membrane protein [Hymenobacter sp. BT491]
MNTKKHLFWKAAVAALLLATAPSCEVLDQDPPSSLTPEEAFSTPERIDKAAIGMYDALQNPEFLGGRALIYSDVRSDDTDPSPYFNTIATFSPQANDIQTTNGWTGGYRTIYGANFFLQNFEPNASKVTPALAAQYVGEAKFIRALTLFTLVNLYAQPYNFTADASHPGVPIQLTAPDAASAYDAAQQLPRASVRDVYTQVIADLTDAAAKLPTDYDDPDYSNIARATKGAAQALLSRVYLYKGDYASAATAANAVITSGLYHLNADPATTFAPPYNTAESIFSVANNISDNPNTNNAIGQHYGPTGRGDITIGPYVAIPTTLFPANDKRRTELVTLSGGIPYTAKFASIGDWVPIARYPEVLLTRAEALARTTGVTQEAVTLLNQVRDRSKGAGTPSYTVGSFAAANALITSILLERRLELAFEGHRYYDLLRTRQGVPARGTAPAVPYGDNKLVLPIPQVDLQNNPNLQQNPGY